MSNQYSLIVYSNQRILTTQQIAAEYGTDVKIISQNFNRHRDRYTVGKHYFLLDGEIKQSFLLNHPQIEDGSKHTSVVYLWTKRGALMHAKSLNTDEAWQAYENLVDTYYDYIEDKLPPTQVQEETPLQGATVIDAIRNRLQVAPVEELEKVRKDVNDYVDATMRLFYPEKQQKTRSKISTQLTQHALPSIGKPAPTPEHIQAEILRHLDRLSSRGKTSLSATGLGDYMTQYTRMQIEIECRSLVRQGVLQVVHTSHTVKYERVGKEI